MTVGETIVNILIGVVSGVISGYIVFFYTEEKQKDRDFKTALYEIHMHLTLLRYLLEDYQEGQDISKLKEAAINEPFHASLKLSNIKHITEDSKEALRNANSIIRDFRTRIIQNKEPLTRNEIVTEKSKMARASVELLKIRQKY